MIFITKFFAISLIKFGLYWSYGIDVYVFRKLGADEAKAISG
jgi:hypothetical protein